MTTLTLCSRCPLCGHRLRLCDDPCPDRPVRPTLRLRTRRHRRARKQRSGSDPSIPGQAPGQGLCQGVVAGVGVVQLPAIVRPRPRARARAQQYMTERERGTAQTITLCPQDVDCTFLNNSIGRHNFLGRTEVFPGDLISRPGSETSLPPIGGVRAGPSGHATATLASPQTASGMHLSALLEPCFTYPQDACSTLATSQGGEQLRGAISAECLYMQGGPDRPRTAMPAYPYRSKTREEFL